MWAKLQKNLRLYAVVERGPGHTYTNKEFVKYAYLAIEATKEFTEDCEKWKLLPPGMRTTEAQLKTHFGKAYKLFVLKGASMRDIHIANQAEIVGILAAKSQELEELQTERSGHINGARTGGDVGLHCKSYDGPIGIQRDDGID